MSSIHIIIDSDAGQYEVKIDSKTFYPNDSGECDLLPILENFALFTPAIFLLQQNAVPVCSFEGITKKFSVPQFSGEDQEKFKVVLLRYWAKHYYCRMRHNKQLQLMIANM